MFKMRYMIVTLILIIISMNLSSIEATPEYEYSTTIGNNYNITPDGKYTYINDAKIFIQAPAEIHGSGWTYINFTSKQYSDNIDLAIGFDTDHLKPKKAQLFHPHLVYTQQTKMIYNVTNYYVHDGTVELDVGEYNVRNTKYFIVEYSQPNYNYSECSMFENCTPENWTTEILVTAFNSTSLVPSEFEVGENYSITWYVERLENWVDITHKFSVLPESIHNNYDDKDKWYYVTEQPINAGVEYQIRIDVSAPPQLGYYSYKYDVVIKPSIYTFQEAIDVGMLYVLDPYWNTSWPWYVEVTINHSMVDQAQTNFPLQLFFNIDGFKSDAADLRVTDDSNNQLAREIEFYNSTTNNGSIFFNMTSLSNTTDDTIRIYGGNAAATEPVNDSTYGSQNVWGDYNTVYLMNNDPSGAEPQLKDSTNNAHDAITSGSMTSGDLLDGMYGKYISFDADDSAQSNSQLIPLTGEYTVLMRYDTVSDIPVDQFGVLYYEATLSNGYKIVYINNPTMNKFGFYTSNGLSTNYALQSSTGFNDGEIHTSMFQLSGTTQKIYFDGIFDVSRTRVDGIGYSTSNFHIANKVIINIYDVRIIDSPLSSNYIATTHKNLNNPTTSGTLPFYKSITAKIYYADSLYYNATSNYNHTIESDGILTINRSMIAVDDTNWTANSTGTTYWQHTTAVTPAGYSNFTISGDNLNNFTTWDLTASTQYDLKNASGTVESQTTNGDGNATFEVDLVAGDYWMEISSVTEITITPNTHAVYGHYDADLLSENAYSTGFVPADIDFYTEMGSTQYTALSTNDDSFVISGGDNQDDGYLYVNFSVPNVTSINSMNITVVGTGDENWYMGAYNYTSNKWETMDSTTETTEVTMNYLITGDEVANYSQITDDNATFSIALWESDGASGIVNGDLISIVFNYEATPSGDSYSTKISETITITDKIKLTKTESHNPKPQETFTISDAIKMVKTAAVVVYEINKPDTITITDKIKLTKTVAPVVYEICVQEVITITDKIATAVLNHINKADTITFTDAIAISKTLAPVLYYTKKEDSITITDEIKLSKTVASVSYSINKVDTFTVTDAIFMNKTASPVEYSIDKADTFTFTDKIVTDKTVASVSYNFNIVDNFTFTDAIKITKTLASVDYNTSITDTFNFTDKISITKTTSPIYYDVNKTDNITIIDKIKLSKTVASVSYSIDKADTFTFTDKIKMNKTPSIFKYDIDKADVFTYTDKIKLNKTVASVSYNIDKADVFTFIDEIKKTKIVSNYDNFTWTNEALVPSVIPQHSYFTYSVDINDSDGIIDSAKISFNSVNYSMTQSGDTWSATIQGAIPTIYRINRIWATDNDGSTNSTTSNLTCDVLRAGGHGGAGGVPTPTPAPTVIPEPTEIPLISVIDDIGNETNITNIIKRLISDDVVKIVKFNFKFHPVIYERTVFIKNSTMCEFSSDVIVSCDVDNETVKIDSNFDPDDHFIFYYYQDYITVFEDNFSHHIGVNYYIVNFAATIGLPQNEINNPCTLLFSENVNNKIDGIRAWWLLLLMIIAGAVIFYVKKNKTL